MRLLVLTHTFPPSRHANAKRPWYLVKGFLDAGWAVDVFTSWMGMPPNASETETRPGLRIFRRKVLADVCLSKCVGHPWLHRGVGLLLAGTSWPDTFYNWVLGSMAESRRFEPYDRVLAFVMPASMLLSGWCKGRVGKQWTFDYQESVTPQFRRMGRRSPLQRALLPALAKLEKHTLHQAGRVIFTADTNRRAYVEAGLVPEPRTAHVPYFFDASSFATPAPHRFPDFQITYFGTFDWSGARSPETFLRSLAGFLAGTPEARGRTRFLFHGNWLPEHNRFIDELGLRENVSIQPPVGYADYIRVLRQSPVLLLVVAAAHNLFMPSKIVDYFGAKRPIMAFVPSGSEMAAVLHNAGMSAFACQEVDVQAGADALQRLWEMHKAGNLEVDAGRTGYWSSEVQLPRYIELATRSVECL
jgi:glycosyltransferase involved in cell wall biosynthesis